MTSIYGPKLYFDADIPAEKLANGFALAYLRTHGWSSAELLTVSAALVDVKVEPSPDDHLHVTVALQHGRHVPEHLMEKLVQLATELPHVMPGFQALQMKPEYV